MKRQITVGFHASVIPLHAPRRPESRGIISQLYVESGTKAHGFAGSFIAAVDDILQGNEGLSRAWAGIANAYVGQECLSVFK
jgi:hypothetical protein